MPELKERNARVLQMREQGGAYLSIAANFNICRQRAVGIVKTLQRERALSAKWPFWSLLSNRTRNALNIEFGEKAFSHPQVILQHGRKHIAMLRNVGKDTLREIDNALTSMGFISKGQEW